MTEVDPMLGAKPEPEPNQNLPAEQKQEEEGPQQPRLKMLGLGQLKDLKPAAPIIDGLVYQNTLVQLAGNPGSFKSFITIGMACAIASGLPNWEGHRIPTSQRGKGVLYIAAEGVQGIWLRAVAWCELAGVPVEQVARNFFVIDGAAQMSSGPDVAEIIDRVRDVDATLVIWDTRARCTVGLEENSATEQGRAIGAADLIRSETGASQLMVHHTTKSGVGGGRGSNAWDGAVWSDLRLRKDGMTAVVQCEKHKDVPAGCEHRFDMKLFTVTPDALPGADEKQRTTLVAIQADDRALAAGGSVLTVAEDKVLKLLDDAAGQEGLSRPQILEMLLERGAGLSKSAVYAAIVSLLKKNRVTCVNPGKRNARFTTEPELLQPDSSQGDETS
ncbi:DNA primase/polymerase [Rhodococcus phage Shagrat]|nr:DNA primase/polymerase [Rhodococcus phage Shagrat]